MLIVDKYIFVDPRVLDSSFPCDNGEADDNGKPPGWEDALHYRLAEVLCPEDHAEGLRILVNECPSCRNLATERGVVRGTASRWKRWLRTRLRKAILAAAWRPTQFRGEAAEWAAGSLARFKTLVIADAVLAEIANNPGATIDHTTAAPVPEADVWCVSLADTERAYSRMPTLGEITAYVDEHRDVLEGGTGRHVGAWYDHSRGVWTLDITVLIRDFAQAWAFAIDQGQSSIYNLKTKVVVHRPTTRRKAA